MKAKPEKTVLGEFVYNVSVDGVDEAMLDIKKLEASLVNLNKTIQDLQETLSNLSINTSVCQSPIKRTTTHES